MRKEMEIEFSQLQIFQAGRYTEKTQYTFQI